MANKPPRLGTAISNFAVVATVCIVAGILADAFITAFKVW